MGVGAVLALDTGSPQISVAVAEGGVLRASRIAPQRQASSALLGLVNEALVEAGARLGELAGIVASRGPGSFTGLRVGLATALGLHQATGIPATAVPTLDVLAASAPGGGRTLALVHALREEWFGQLFAGEPARAVGEPARRGIEQHIAAAAPERCIGFGLEALASSPAVRGLALLAPDRPLAAVAALRASREPPLWDPHLLTTPLYLASPAVTPPAAPKPVLDRGQRA